MKLNSYTYTVWAFLQYNTVHLYMCTSTIERCLKSYYSERIIKELPKYFCILCL